MKYLWIFFTLMSLHLHAQNTVNLFVISLSDNDVSIEQIEIPENEVRVINSENAITAVLPLSIGLSGDLVTEERRKGTTIIAQNSNGQLHLKIRDQGGREKSLPSVLIADLRSFNTKVHVTRGNGSQKLFAIERFESVKELSGTVMDMFGGRVPMKANDFAITLETSQATEKGMIVGSVPLKLLNKWPTVEIRLPNGKTGIFVIDCAASGSLISRKSLPDNSVITKVSAEEYNLAEDKKTSKAASIQGAGDQVSTNYLGKVTLSKISIGSVNLADQQFNVLDKLPDFMVDHHIDGIAGLDILKQASFVSLLFKKSGPTLRFDNQRNTSEFTFTIPFEIVGKLLVAQGKLDGYSVKLILDTGARGSIVSKDFISSNNLSYEKSKSSEVRRGLDNRALDMVRGRFKVLNVHNACMVRDFESDIGSLGAFSYLGIQNEAILLGMDFFSRWEEVLFDFTKNELLLK